jgi:hypothetical protein
LIGQDLVFTDMSTIDWIGFLFFPLGVFVGLVFAWREELPGGSLIVMSVAGFYLVYGGLLNPSIQKSWTLLPFLIPGMLFIIYGVVRGTKGEIRYSFSHENKVARVTWHRD